jgi:hypothetical protein
MVSEELGSIMWHCIVYQAHVHAENLDPEHVMAPVVSAAVFIEPKMLSHSQFRSLAGISPKVVMQKYLSLSLAQVSDVETCMWWQSKLKFSLNTNRTVVEFETKMAHIILRYQETHDWTKFIISVIGKHTGRDLSFSKSVGSKYFGWCRWGIVILHFFDS